ncbi:MAG: efflux RND transporter periplasmic adaptor subunit [Rikenellaceae bacterium]
MKKVLVLITTLAIVACGSNQSTKKSSTDTKTTTSCGDSACTEDHTKEAHNHKPGETCPSEKKATKHNHAEGETCPSEQKAEKAKDGHNHAEGETCGAEAEHAHPDPNFVEVQLKEGQAKEAHIETYLVKATSDFSSVIKTTGKVSSNKTDKKVIVAPTSGVVNIIAPNLVDGVAVAKGKALVAVSTAKIEGGDLIKKTTARYQAAKSDFERAKSLIGDKLISQSDFNAIKVTFTTAQAEYDALNAKSGNNGVRVSSPINGYLTELLVKDGEYVEAGAPLMIVSAGNKALLTAYVSERYYGRLRNITGANFKTAYNNNVYDIKDLGGKVIAYGKGENDESYLVPVTFEFNNSADILPGSFVEVYLKEKPMAGAIAIPLSAVTEEQNVYYVYTHRGEQLYRKNEVKLGANDGKFVEVLSGIKDGDKVVTKGTYQIKLASSSGVIPAACGHQH